MKLTAFVILITALQVSAKTYSQEKVSVSFEKTRLDKALKEVEKKSSFRFVFSNRLLSDKLRITFEAKEIYVEELVSQLLANTGLTYSVMDNNLVVIKKSNVDFIDITVRGKVTDSKGNPLANVSISAGEGKGTTTNERGEYTIAVDEDANLVFSYVGFISQTIKINKRTVIDLTLAEGVAALDEVIVVGYGTQKKVNLTGAVSTIDAKALESRPVRNLSQALQGMIPGLNLQTSGLGGELNSTLNVNIRGGGTIGAGSNSSPLILIDGMEGNMNAINYQDIESISVLKDAAAASIYGSRAPFGVILITTKKGKAGKTSINYNNNFRATQPLGLPSMMDSHTFALYYNEAAANDGEGPKFGQEVLDRIVKYQKGEIDYATVPNANGDRYQMYTGSNANTDWFKEQYRSSAFAQEHSVSMNGGAQNIQYFASGSYSDQGGLSRHSNDQFKRYTFTGKMNITLNKYVKFNYTNRYIREDYSKASHQFDLFYHNIARRWPTVPAKDPNGHWTDASEIAQLREGGRTKDQTDWLYQQGQLVINPLKGWNIVADANFRITNNNYHGDITPAYSYDVAGNPYALSVGWNSPGFTNVYEYNRKENFFTTNIYSDYTFKVRDNHQFKALVGFNSELNRYRTLAASRANLITPDLPTINTATTDSKAEEGQYQHWATAGFFGRLNYNFKERYLLELNARYDGTSRFIGDKRWNLFPSVSAGWNVAKENFWSFSHIIQTFKLRGSYGELGNQNTSNWYPFFPTMPVGVANGSWLVNGAQPNTASAPGIVSSLLTWERVSSWNLGFDLAMLQNKLTLNFDYFNRKTLDMVGPAPELPVVLGTSVPQINNADMESYGFEIEAKWQDRIGELGYSVRAVLADDQQRVTNYPNPTNNINNWYNGRKSGEIWGYTTIGIAQSNDEMDKHLATVNQNAAGGNWGAGDIMYADKNGDGKFDGGTGVLGNTGDRSIIGNSTARYRYSFDLSADWKGFDLRIFAQGVGKRDWMPNGPYFWGANGGMWQSAAFKEHMNFYRDENSVMVKAGIASVNKDSYFPKPYFNTGKNQITQTRYLQSAAYLRLKNIQLGYTLPKRIVSVAGMSNVRVYVSAENILTFTKMIDIFDPETVALSGWNDGKTYPLAKVYSCGISINF